MGTTAFAFPTSNVTVPTGVPASGTGTLLVVLVLVTVTLNSAVGPVVGKDEGTVIVTLDTIEFP